MPSLAMPLEEGRVVLPGSFPLIMAMHLAPWRNYRIQMVTAKSNPLCGGRFVAAAALGAEMGFGRLGGGQPCSPHSQTPFWPGGGLRGDRPPRAPPPARRRARGPASRQHVRRHFQSEGLCRFMLKYSCIFAPRLCLLICK